MGKYVNPRDFIEVISPTHPTDPESDPLMRNNTWKNPVSNGRFFHRQVGDGDLVVGDPTDFKNSDADDFDEGWDLIF